MQKNQAAARSGSGGYALLTVTVFALILLTAGVSYYSVATYETRGAIQRARMMQAFYLADGAVERARAKFLEDRVWRDGWTDVAEADGRYGLALADTVVDGERAMRITATGQVGTITRRIVLLGSAPPTALDLAILTGRNLRATGNLCLQGRAHANDDANFGAGDRRLRCGGTYTERFRLTPPALYTEPDSFPGATYYFLRGMRVGSNTYAKIYDADMNDITSVIGDSLGGIVSYAASSKTFTYTFANANISKYFADPDGKFARAPGDHAVVVNFGASPPNPPDVLSIVTFNGNAVVHARDDPEHPLCRGRQRGPAEQRLLARGLGHPAASHLRAVLRHRDRGPQLRQVRELERARRDGAGPFARLRDPERERPERELHVARRHLLPGRLVERVEPDRDPRPGVRGRPP
jgi:hypothetical protein